MTWSVVTQNRPNDVAWFSFTAEISLLWSVVSQVGLNDASELSFSTDLPVKSSGLKDVTSLLFNSHWSV